MAEKISFLLFGEQSLDTQGFLADFCRNGNPSILSHAFLNRVASTLQNEIERLPSLERRHIPSFTTIQELSQRYHTRDVTHPAIDSALLVTTQLAHYIEYVLTTILLLSDAYNTLVEQKRFRKMLQDHRKHGQLASAPGLLPPLRFPLHHLSRLL